MYDSTDYMSSSEKLVSFLDGELSQEQISTLFYELAQNQELQDEMKHYVHLKNSLRNSQVAPPHYLKKNVLKATGLVDGPIAFITDKGAKTAALLAAMFYNRTSMSVLALALLSLATIFYLNRNEIDDKSTQSSLANVTNKTDANSVLKSKIPVTSSYSTIEDDSQVNNLANEIGRNMPISKSNSLSAKSNVPFSDLSNVASFDPNSNDFASSDNYDRVLNADEYFKISESSFNTNIPIEFKSVKPSWMGIYSLRNTFDNLISNTSFYFRRFGAQSYPNFNLTDESSPIFNNISAGFKYRLDENHSFGVAGGMENFLMSFNRESDGIVYRYDQSWNGMWLGFTYHYTFNELGNGVFPELSFLLGSTATGPIVRGTLGLNYFITDRFYLSAGGEIGSLIYSEKDASGSKNWYSTEKLGYTFGFGVGF